MFKPKKLTKTEREEAAGKEIRKILDKYRCTLDATTWTGPGVPGGSVRKVDVIALDDEVQQ